MRLLNNYLQFMRERSMCYSYSADNTEIKLKSVSCRSSVILCNVIH